MHVELVRVDNAFHFQAEGSASKGNITNIDAAENIGGHNAGTRPMELLLMGLGGCTAIDILLILKKQRQEVRDFKIGIDGEREKIEGTEMSPFRKIHLTFTISGDVSLEKAQRAVQLSMDKYCSATAQLAASAEITHSVVVEA